MFVVDTNGNMTITQGDSGRLVVNGIPIDDNYTVYFAIQDKNRRPIGEELSVEANFMPTIEFRIPASLTDLLKVPTDEETETYYYGVKICNLQGEEDTLIIGGGDISSLNEIIVYPKKVEGI